MERANYLMQKLNLRPLEPEGGYFNEFYRSEIKGTIEGFPANKSVGTIIYYMLVKGIYSFWHRLTIDESWHFHEGATVRVYIIEEDGNLRTVDLGNEEPSVVFPRGCWFAAELKEGDYALMSCVCFPAFEYDHFELGNTQKMLEEFPQHSEVINKFK